MSGWKIMYIQVGKRIKRARLRAGLTQEQFAARAGLHRAYVGAAERGEKNFRLSTLKLIADTLGVRVGYLVRDL